MKICCYLMIFFLSSHLYGTEISIQDSVMPGLSNTDSLSVIDSLNDNTAKLNEAFIEQFQSNFSAISLSVGAEEKACSDEDNSYFSEQLNEATKPFLRCQKDHIRKTLNKEKYCQCIGEKSSITYSEFKAVSEDLRKEAKEYSEQIVSSNMMVLQDKMFAMVALHNQLTNNYPGYQNKCTPEKMIEALRQAAKSESCANGKLKELDKYFKDDNVYDKFVESIEKLNKSTKKQALDKEALNDNIEQLSPLIIKAMQYNSGTLKLNTSEVKALKKEIEAVISKSSIIRHFTFKLQSPNNPRINFKVNELSQYTNGMSSQPDLGEILKEKLGNNDLFDADKTLRGLKRIVGDEIRKVESFCDAIPSNVNFICEKALSTDYSMAQIQNNTLHLAKIVNRSLDNRSVEELTKFSDISYSFNPGLTVAQYHPTQSIESQILSEKVDMLQCAYSYPQLAPSLVLGIIPSEKDKDLFMMSKYTPSYFSSIGQSANYRNLLNDAILYDPFKKLEKAEEEQMVHTTASTLGKDLSKFRLEPTKRTRSTPSEVLNRAFGSGAASSPSALTARTGPVSSLFSGDKTNGATDTNGQGVVTHATSNQASYTPMPALPTSVIQSNVNLPSEAVTPKNPSDYQSVIDSYEQRLATMMEKLAEVTSSKKTKESKAKAGGEGQSDEDLDVVNEEETTLKNTIGQLKDQIETLKQKKEAATSVKNQTSVSQTPAKPFQLAPRKISNTGRTNYDSPVNSPAPTPQAAKSSFTSNSSSSSPSSATSSSFLSTSTLNTGKEFTLKAEDINLEGKMVVSAKEFKINDQKFVSELYQKANGEPVYVTQMLPDGTEEVMVYEPVKLPDGTITYVPKKVAAAAEVKKAAKPVAPAATKDQRKRVKVQDLNQLIQTVK